jgi:hypothetical protein
MALGIAPYRLTIGTNLRALSRIEHSRWSPRIKPVPARRVLECAHWILLLSGQRRRRRNWQVKSRERRTTMGIVDCNGLPLTVTTHAANHHEVTLVQLTFDFNMIEAKPEKRLATKLTIAIAWMRS